MIDRENKIWHTWKLDSDEEFLFLCWYMEAQELGLVGNIVRQPEFPLSERQAMMTKHPTRKDPNNMKEKFLLHPHSYKADFSFEVVVEDDGNGNLVPVLNSLSSTNAGKLISHFFMGRYICIVDVKGGWSNHRSRNSSDVTFPINQKWVYAKHGLYVNKVEITPKKGLFKEFWAPDEAFETEKGNPSKKYRTCCTFDLIKEEIERRSKQ